MLNAKNDSILAVDGGGTRCRLVLSGTAGQWSVEMGSANVTSDFDGAVHQIKEGLAALSSQSGLAPEALYQVPAYLGLAGVTGPAIATRLEQALPLAHTRIADDRPIALRGALGDRDGAIAHCGTGSFFALQSGGQMRLAGGWGLILGDEASAAWVGRLALTRALAVVDGLGQTTPLIEEIMATRGDSAAIVEFAASAKPAEFGHYAKLVSRHAAEGDTQAVSLMTAAADHIATSLADLGFLPGQALCLTGGIGPVYAPYLPKTLQAALVTPVGTPLEGALALAEEFREELVA